MLSIRTAASFPSTRGCHLKQCILLCTDRWPACTFAPGQHAVLPSPPLLPLPSQSLPSGHVRVASFPLRSEDARRRPQPGAGRACAVRTRPVHPSGQPAGLDRRRSRRYAGRSDPLAGHEPYRSARAADDAPRPAVASERPPREDHDGPRRRPRRARRHAGLAEGQRPPGSRGHG